MRQQDGLLYEDLTRTPLRIAQQDRGSKDP